MPAVQMLGAAIKKTAMRSGLLRLASRFGTRKVAILRYHSVLEAPDEFGNSIGINIIHSRQIFDEQMALLASRYHPVSLDQVCAFVQGKIDLPRRSVAITFDDGFADNLDVAAPILARYAIPVAIYLATDYIGNRTPPWYCRLRYAFSVSVVPKWRVDNEIAYDMTLPEQRLLAFLDSSRKCAKLCGNPQEELLAEIEDKLDIESFSTPVMLTWLGVRQLLAQGHIIGSHTLSHPNVAYVSRREIIEELVGSKAEIEKQTRVQVKHFAYPSPIMEPHYSNETVAITKEAGYSSAVTCSPGTVVSGDDTLSLKRLYAPQKLMELDWALENVFLGRRV